MEVSCNGAEPVMSLGVAMEFVTDPIPELSSMHWNPTWVLLGFSLSHCQGLCSPEDVYFDVPGEMPDQWACSFKQGLFLFLKKSTTKQRWASIHTMSTIGSPAKKRTANRSVALVEFNETPKHFHQIEKEIFIVVHGTLNIEIDGHSWILKTGECVEVNPGMVHHLKSHGKDPVRVLCFNFPAFSQEDYHIVE